MAVDPERLFADHQPRAVAFASAYCRQINACSRHLLDDIISEALLGLWQACLKFEQTSNNTFWTFAYMRVRGSVIDFLRREKIIMRGFMVERGDQQIEHVPLLPWESKGVSRNTVHSGHEIVGKEDNATGRYWVGHNDSIILDDKRSEAEMRAIEDRIDIDKYASVCGVDKISILKEFYCEEKTLVEIGRSRNLGKDKTSQLIHEGTAQLRQATGV